MEPRPVHTRLPRSGSRDSRVSNACAASRRGDSSLPPILDRGGAGSGTHGGPALLAPSGTARRAGSEGPRRTDSAPRAVSGAADVAARRDGSLPPIARGACATSAGTATSANARTSSRGSRPPAAPCEESSPSHSFPHRSSSNGRRVVDAVGSRTGAAAQAPLGGAAHGPNARQQHANGYNGKTSHGSVGGAPRSGEARRRAVNGYGGHAPQVPAASQSSGETHAPSAAQVRRGAEEAAERAMAMAEADAAPLLPCRHCSRKFTAVAHAKHILICQKVFQRKRKVYNTTEHRLPDEPELVAVRRMAAKQTKKGEIGIGTAKEVAPMKSAWRQKSKQFRAAMRDGKTVDKYKREGRPMSELPPTRATDPECDDRIPCPHCGRKFGSVQAERHIPHCKSSKANAGRPTGRVPPVAPRPSGGAGSRSRKLA